jgi:integrase
MPDSYATLLQLRGDHLFHSGHAKPKSVVGDYQRSLRKVFQRAKVPRAFPHLFRHRFITNMLTAGVPVETVAVLAGHRSSKITFKAHSHGEGTTVELGSTG